MEQGLTRLLRRQADHSRPRVCYARHLRDWPIGRGIGRARNPDHGSRGRRGGPTRPLAAPSAQGGAPSERQRDGRAGRVRSGQWGVRGGGATTPRAELIADREPDPLRPIRHLPYGDVTVLGSVSSGAEVVAGGSIHIYGALRGRAMAGSMGNARARIFCSKNEAELISIDGYYRTSEEMDATLRTRPAQCWLDDRVLLIAALD